MERAALQMSIYPSLLRIPDDVIDLVPDHEATTYAMPDRGLQQETTELYLTNLVKRADNVIDRITISGTPAPTGVALLPSDDNVENAHQAFIPLTA